MLFEVNVIGINTKKKISGNFSKHQVIETFDKIPWGNIILQLEEKNASTNDSPSFGIVNKEDDFGLIVAPINNEGWVIYFRQELKRKVFFGLFKNSEGLFTEKRKQDLNSVKECIDLFLNQKYQSLGEICAEKTF